MSPFPIFDYDDDRMIYKEDPTQNLEFAMNFFNKFSQPKQDFLACYHCHIVKSETASHTNNCPNCGRGMYNMGAGFTPPRPSDKIEWEKVALLVKHNFTFEYLPA